MKQITCMCEHKFSAAIPNEIDCQKKAETVASILDGSFMAVMCPSCRKVLKPEFPFKIFDKSAGWEINFIPELNRQQVMKKTQAGKKSGWVRIVIGFPELVEKIKILKEKLDDRVIEYLKYFIMSKVLEKSNNDENEITLWYDERTKDELVFHIVGLKNDQVGIFKIPFSTYVKAVSDIEIHAAEETFSEFLSPPYVSLNKLSAWVD